MLAVVRFAEDSVDFEPDETSSKLIIFFEANYLKFYCPIAFSFSKGDSVYA